MVAPSADVWRPPGVLVLLLVACRPASPPPYAGSLVELTVRVSLPGAPPARVAAFLDALPAVALRHGPALAEWHGGIAAAPGPHQLRIEAIDGDGNRLGETALDVKTFRGAPTRADATLAPAAASGIAAILAPRTSLMAGEGMTLRARVMGSPAPALTWTTTPPGCGAFANPRGTITPWIAAAPGPCTISLEADAAGASDRRSLDIVVRTPARAHEYPLRIGPGGRYLVDARGKPFLIKGESAWLALVNLTALEQEQYLLDRAARGFNMVEVMLVNHDYTSSPGPKPPANRAGEQPFAKAGDFSTPNDAYFDRAVAFVDRAAAHGLVVLIAPNYLGFDGDREGWWAELIAPANTRAVCAAFGRYLGARFKGKKNVLWLAGGDFAPPHGSEGEARHQEILDGIRAAGATQPWTGHWNVDHLGGISTDQAKFSDAMALNGVYQYAGVYRYTQRAFDVRPPRPVFLLESTYEHEHPRARTQPFRKAWWWTMLSGGAGVVWGNAFLWLCESARGSYAIDYGEVDRAVSSWSAELESPGTFEMLHLHALFEGLPWQRLVPAGPASGGPALVVDGQSGGEDHIAAAATAEGDLLVAYVPPAGTKPRSFALDLSRMRGPLRGRWYDPGTGGFLPLADPVTTSARVELRTPGANGVGSNDWALVVDSSGPR